MMKEAKVVPNDAIVPDVAMHGAAKAVAVGKGISDARVIFSSRSVGWPTPLSPKLPLHEGSKHFKVC
jgi:hypothetical protein